jgi:hypothetical protein
LRQTSSQSEHGVAEIGPTPADRDCAPPETRALLPRRDYFILPVLSLLTIAIMFAAAEIGTRLTWSAIDQGYCMNFDPVEGPHGRPNCTTILKIPEGERVTLKFNSCGYRSNAPCGPKPAGTVRIAVIGSSIAEGYGIAYNETMATQMTVALRRACHIPVEVQNLAAEACPPIYSYRHVDEALKLTPDAVVMPLNPWDIEQQIDPKLLARRSDPRPIDRMPEPEIKLSAMQQLQMWVRGSRSVLVAQHYMLQNRDAFLKLYLFAGGDHAGFVHFPFTPAWEKRFDVTDLLLGEMATKIHAAGVPFVLIGIPERAQTLMLGLHDLPAGVDAYAFTRRLSEIAAKHGIIYVDALKVFEKSASRENLFYVVDGHPTAEAQELMGQAIARKLMTAKIPGLSRCAFKQ